MMSTFVADKKNAPVADRSTFDKTKTSGSDYSTADWCGINDDHPISNHEFLSAVFTDLWPDEYLWACNFRDQPSQGRWSGHRVTGALQDQPDHNTYFSVSALKPDDKGSKRRKTNFSRLYCVVLDDAAPLAGIEPTWVLETSHPAPAPKTQVGYRLTDPVADSGIADRLHHALGAAGHLSIDKSGNNPVRYVRLPVGSNTKHNPPHRHRLITWSPDTRVTLDDLIAALRLDRDAIINEPVGEPRQAHQTHRTATGSGSGGGFFRALNDAALGNLAAWVPEIFPRAKPYQGGFRVASKDLGRRLEEDLSLLPDGIWDFGEEIGQTAIDVVLAWTDIRREAEAAKWLCGRLGIEPGSLGWVEPTAAHGAKVAESIFRGDAEAEPANGAPSQHEAEQLLAWSWRTGTKLPAADQSGIFKGQPLEPGGKPPERLRVDIVGHPSYTAPWLSIAWKHGPSGFLAEAEKYCERRTRKTEGDALRTGKPPDDIPADVLMDDARAWLARVQTMQVDESTGGELLARVIAGMPGTKARPFRLVHVRDLLADPPPLVWLVEDWIPPESQVLLFGDPAAGKSLIAIDWAASIATGRNWCGKATAPSPVVYIAGEGHHGIRRRLKAWAQHNGCEAQLRESPLVVSESGASLIEPASVAAVIEATDAAAAELGKPALVVIDTLHRNLGPGDENSAQDIAAYVQAADELRTRYECTVLTVHHSGHGEKGRARGSSAIRAAVDAEFMVIADQSDARVLSCPAKMKDAPKPGSLSFALSQVELPWIKANGEPETSVVLVQEQGVGTATRRASDGLRLAFEALLWATTEGGITPPDHWRHPTAPQPERLVTLERWRGAFYARHSGDSIDAKRRAFNRARKDLADGGAVGVWMDAYWPVCGASRWTDLDDMYRAHLLTAGGLKNEAA